MSFLNTAPPPKSPLGRYRLLSPNAGVRVSPLCLGTMNFGTSWKDFTGICEQGTAEEILDFFYSQGGNFLDTSSNYQNGESEVWLGEWMKKRGIRNEMVIATKYSSNYRIGMGKNQIMINYQGNSSKSLHVSVEDSLKKLQTDYIDLLYVHWWDFSTSIPEMMQSLNALVTSGKVIYLGISDSPAWVVSKANQYARDHGLRQFSVYQGQWSAAERDFEREILHMVRDEGMGLAPWGALGSGAFKTDEERKSQEGRKWPASEKHIRVSKVLESIASRKGTRITSVALAYVMHKAPYVFPIVGGRKVDHLKGNIEALTLELSTEEMEEIESAIPFDPGFPSSFFWGEKPPAHPANVWLLNTGGVTDYVELPKPIKPAKAGE